MKQISFNEEKYGQFHTAVKDTANFFHLATSNGRTLVNGHSNDDIYACFICLFFYI